MEKLVAVIIHPQKAEDTNSRGLSSQKHHEGSEAWSVRSGALLLKPGCIHSNVASLSRPR